MAYPKPAVQLPRINGILPKAPTVLSYPYTPDRPTVGGTQHFHWTIQAYRSMDNEGNMQDVAIVRVEAPNEMMALARAMDVLERNEYRVVSVDEICSKDTALKGE